jgi:hypothetical protein
MACALFYFIRGQLQINFLMGRPEGWLWFDPGLPSMVIVYHPCNDFFYSGHVGLSTLLMTELWICGDKTGFMWGFFIMINEWLMLTLVRTHYIIDMSTGLICAIYTLRLCEILAYLWDVRGAGIRNNKRQSFFF